MIISTEKLYINDPINIFIGCNFDYINNIDGTKILFGNILNNNIENIKNSNCYYILGAKDLKYNKDISFKTYNILQIYRDSRLLSFICGGISKELRIDDLKNNIDICIAKDKLDWHKKYKGNLGYIISNNLLKQDNIIKYYNYSANIYKDGFCHIQYTDRIKVIYES